jgi:spermidine synthase
MNGLGTHILLDLYGCDPDRLNNLEFLRQMSLEGVRRSGATIVGDHFKQFEPQGVSGVIIIAESHLSLHTWPEYSYIAMDYFTCGDHIDISEAIAYFEDSLMPQKVVTSRLGRGNGLDRTNTFTPVKPQVPILGDWYTEYHWDGDKPERFVLGYKYAVERHLVHVRSAFQDILVMENPVYGRMLFIDGFVMTSEKDEFVYHEMLSHVPLIIHGKPREVLIIGGGDGGLLREVLRHPQVERVDMVELDQKVVEVSKEYLPTIGSEFENPKATLFFQDGAEFIKSKKTSYDVILVDSTDPTGPGRVLFEKEFFQNCKEALRENGIFTAQALSAWVQEQEQMAMFTHLRSVWKTVIPYIAAIPTYPGALWTFAIASDLKVDPMDFDHQYAAEIARRCRYYNPKVHEGSFYLPNFLKDRLDSPMPLRH